MLYLILSIISSFGINQTLKFSEFRREDTRVVIAANYLFSGVSGWIISLYYGEISMSRETFLLGMGGGLLWPGALYLFIWGIRQYGISLTGAASRLALVVPVLFALLFLDEELTRPHLFGLLCAFSAFYMLNPVKFSALSGKILLSLCYFPLLALVWGLVNLWVNLFNHIGPEAEKFLFITLVFSASALTGWAVVFLKKLQVKGSALLLGAFLGIPNFFTSYCLMECLKTPEFAHRSAVAYTIYAASGVALTFAAGTLIWKERLSRLNTAGVMAVIMSIILLNQ